MFFFSYGFWSVYHFCVEKRQSSRLFRNVRNDYIIKHTLVFGVFSPVLDFITEAAFRRWTHINDFVVSYGLVVLRIGCSRCRACKSLEPLLTGVRASLFVQQN